MVGGHGQFDVVVDGDAVFSKQRLGRFPEPGEIVRLVGDPGAGRPD